MTSRRDPRVDIYIGTSAEFAKPILVHVRKSVHAASPDIEETLKWGHPSFLHDGAILCGIAAFKEHSRFHIWKGGAIRDRDGAPVNDSMHALKKVSDLPRERRVTQTVEWLVEGKARNWKYK